MRQAKQGPAGSVHVPGTSIRMYSDARGSWQKLETAGATSTYRVDYVIGSGAHASGYMTTLGDHLFQSPVAYYKSRAAYDLAPGYEGKPDPDFTRPVADGCVFCHAGSSSLIAGTQNGYGRPPFPHLAIGCERCHGAEAAHLLKPQADNIVNPAHLERSARDSVCEQCHLIGVARVLNPGKNFADFKPGEPLENTFTIYRNEMPKTADGALKVISHSEQLAQSACLRNSNGRMWCGTCHDPHNEPADPVSSYRERCLICHGSTKLAANHPSKSSNCIGCHMPKREANDGGHSAFTDDRIQRRPEHATAAEATAIAAWREPWAALGARNLGIASVDVGMERRSPKDIVAGYRLLTEVQRQFPEDSELYNTIGNALFVGKQYGEAVKAFELAVRFDPGSSQKEANLAQAYEATGDPRLAQQHLERAMEIDPLNLNAAVTLIRLYDTSGQIDKGRELARKLSELVGRKASE